MIQFEVYHLESNDGISERYYSDIIEAENIDKAIEIFKNEWIKPEFKNDVQIDYQDKGLCYITGFTDYFDENGNELSFKQVQELEKSKDMDISELIENDIIGYLDHSYELRNDEIERYDNKEIKE